MSVRGLVALASTLLTLLSLSAPVNAITIDLRNAGGGGGGFGNSLNFSSGGLNFRVYAFAESGAQNPVGSEWYLFQSAEIWSWDTGLGVCNRTEGQAFAACDSRTHEIDTVGRDDLVAFVFDRRVDFRAVTVDPHDGTGNDPNDRDIAYWVGNAPALPNLTTQSFNTLAGMPGFGAPTFHYVSSSFQALTHQLTGTGTILLLSGNFAERNCVNANTNNNECEAWKVKNLTVDIAPAVVPLPGAAWLFGPAIGLFGFLRRR